MFPSSQKILLEPFLANNPLLSLRSSPVFLYRYRLVLPVHELHMNGITQHVLVCVWLLLHRIMSWGSMHIGMCIYSLFF